MDSRQIIWRHLSHYERSATTDITITTRKLMQDGRLGHISDLIHVVST